MMSLAVPPEDTLLVRLMDEPPSTVYERLTWAETDGVAKPRIARVASAARTRLAQPLIREG